LWDDLCTFFPNTWGGDPPTFDKPRGSHHFHVCKYKDPAGNRVTFLRNLMKWSGDIGWLGYKSKKPNRLPDKHRHFLRIPLINNIQDKIKTNTSPVLHSNADIAPPKRVDLGSGRCGSARKLIRNIYLICRGEPRGPISFSQILSVSEHKFLRLMAWADGL
jgi:hypothetical protein